MSDQKEQKPLVEEKVSILPITQATTATFSDFYFRLTFFFFIQTGSKRVLIATNLRSKKISPEGHFELADIITQKSHRAKLLLGLNLLRSSATTHMFRHLA